MLVACAGALLILAGIVLILAQLAVSIRTRQARRDLTGDPWNGRTLEWSTTSPPPPYNFAVLPAVDGIDAFWTAKRHGAPRPPVRAEPIEMPRNSPAGFIIAFFATAFGFAMIWHIWWLAGAGLLGVLAVALTRAWQTETKRDIEPIAEGAR